MLRKIASNATRWRRIVALGLLSVALSSCGQIPLEDVSSHAEYKGVVGARFRTKVDLLLIGVTADQNYKKQIDYFVLVPEPGFSGPEVVRKEKLAKGSSFRIAQVLQSKLFFVPRVYYVVEVSGAKTEAPVRIKQTGSAQDGNAGLDASTFEKPG